MPRDTLKLEPVLIGIFEVMRSTIELVVLFAIFMQISNRLVNGSFTRGEKKLSSCFLFPRR